MSYTKLTKNQLIDEIKRQNLDLPKKGSGKNDGVLKRDLIYTLSKKGTDVDRFSNLSLDMIIKIAYDLSGETLFKYCQLSKKFSSVYSKEYFWIKKYKLDFNDIPKPVSLKDRYMMKINERTKLGKFLLKYTNFDDLKFYKQRKLYILALSEFKSLEFYYEDNNDDLNMTYENIRDYVLQDIGKFIFGSKTFLSYFGRESANLETFTDDYQDDNDFLNEILDVFNDVTENNYTFNEAYNFLE